MPAAASSLSAPVPAPAWMAVPVFDLCEDACGNDGKLVGLVESASDTSKTNQCWSKARNSSTSIWSKELSTPIRSSSTRAFAWLGSKFAPPETACIDLCNDSIGKEEGLHDTVKRRRLWPAAAGSALHENSTQASTCIQSSSSRARFPIFTPQAPPSGVAGTAVFTEPGRDFLCHLEDYGYAVLQGVLGDSAACNSFLQCFWDAMTTVMPSVDPLRRETWSFPKGFRGIVTTYGLPQADFAWRIRSAPRIQEAFAQIFGTQDLVTSLDAVIAQEGVSKSKLPAWLHKDQRPSHQGLSVQAVYTHFGSGPHDAGTCVVPGSHKVTYTWENAARGEHIRAPSDSELRAIKPDMPADSVIFFNSRLVHASVCGTSTPSALRPARLGACVAYAPRMRRSEATRRRKELVYLEGKCSTHWPCDSFSAKPPPKHYQVLKGAVHLPKPPRTPERLELL